MKILVPIKRVIDYHVNIRVKSDGSGVEKNNVKMSINPFDEIALEEAVRLKESGKATDVVALTVGENVSQDILRKALALGADRAVLLETEEQMRPLELAKLLKKYIEKELFDLVLMGKQAIDGDNNQTGQMLSALLGWPQATFASSISISDNALEVVREIDGGLETIKTCLPAVVTTDLRLNEPRFAALPNIMKAKRKPLDILSVSELGIDVKSAITRVKVMSPPSREAGIKVESVSELVDKLVNEAKVIG